MSLNKNDLLSLEEYSQQRPEIRKKVMAHKAERRLHIGENVVFCFESRLTMQYQIQEMLRIERIFEADLIQEELDTYNPLVPDGSGFRASMMVEFVNPEERQKRLAEMGGLEHTLWFATNENGENKIKPTVNPDLERSNEQKTSAVHFVFFNFEQQQIKEILNAENWFFGIDHPAYGPIVSKVEKTLKSSLSQDLLPD